MNDITYVYTGGRQNKLSNKKNYASEFFYGFNEFKCTSKKINFVELPDINTNFSDKLLIKLTKLPIYYFKSKKTSNLNYLLESKNLIFVNESSFFSFIPFISKNYKKFKGNILYIPMGLVDRFKNGTFLTKLIIKKYLKFIDSFLFIGKGEMESYKNEISLYIDKCHFINFSVDTNFWKAQNKEILKLKNLLFIGNDNNRDFEFLNQLVESLSEYEFSVITNNKKFYNKTLSNVSYQKGHWRSDQLSDKEILVKYLDADLVILPIKNVSQPSGQSVALQAMSTGTPVLITNTKGFWDSSTFLNDKNIFFVEENKITTWKKRIDFLSNNIELLSEVGKNGRDVVHANYNLNNFTQKIKKYLV